jgi:hypothetical protein
VPSAINRATGTAAIERRTVSDDIEDLERSARLDPRNASGQGGKDAGMSGSWAQCRTRQSSRASRAPRSQRQGDCHQEVLRDRVQQDARSGAFGACIAPRSAWNVVRTRRNCARRMQAVDAGPRTRPEGALP